MADTCKFNVYITCPAEGRKCYKCGWNPLVEAKRKKEAKSK